PALRAGHHLSILGHRRVGGCDRQHAVAGRQGVDGRDRSFRHPVAADGRALGYRGGLHARRLAPRCGARGDRGQAGAGRVACDQGRHGGAQRNLHRGDQPGRRNSQRYRQGRPSALLLVDTISSLGSVDYRHDEWKVDVTVSCSQKGFMLPPGLGFNAISDKARAAAKTNKLPRSYWDWEEMLKPNAAGFFPYTPATNLLYGLREAIAMLLEEGLDQVFARHKRLAAATRAAVAHWGLEVLCLEPAEYSPVLTAVLMPPGHDADQFRKTVLDNYNMSLGSGLTKLAGKVFRIGHLGECNELTLLAALTGVEMGLSLAGVPHRAGGVAAAMTFLEERTQSNTPAHLKVISS